MAEKVWFTKKERFSLQSVENHRENLKMAGEGIALMIEPMHGKIYAQVPNILNVQTDHLINMLHSVLVSAEAYHDQATEALNKMLGGNDSPEV